MTILRELAAATLEAASLTACESQRDSIDGRWIDDGSDGRPLPRARMRAI